MATAVVCVGNELVGDDGVGIRVGRVLERLALPDRVSVIVQPNLGLELLELLGVYDEIVIVDAMTSGRAPGTCVRISAKEAARMANCPSCAHSLGIPEMLQIAQQLVPDRGAAAVYVVGVEAASIDMFGIGLSEPVRAALPEAVDAVLCAVGASEELRSKGREYARAEASAVVTISDVLAGSSHCTTKL
jgi:hydrogenase maturation protease